VIVLTGDLVDSRNTDIRVGIDFGIGAAAIAPTYYVPGNHEARIPEYEQLKSGLKAAGVTVLENERTELVCGTERIALLGIADPSFFGSEASYADIAAAALEQLTGEQTAYSILLAHRPELFDCYVQSGVDLVLSGHAHGGQIRLPLIGGLYAPGQGFFPQYDGGIYQSEHTHMIVSRGIGNSLFPFRVNNRPEIAVVELMRA